MSAEQRAAGRRSLLAAAALAPLVGAQAQGDAPAAQRRAWPASRPTPALELPAWEAPPFRLADARGQVVVLNFWASWCEPCRAEMPSLELLAERHAGDRLQVQAINHRETDGAIRRFLAAWPLTLNILRDSDGAAARAWQVRVFPSTVVIGRNGRAAFTATGEVDWGGREARQWLAGVL